MGPARRSAGPIAATLSCLVICAEVFAADVTRPAEIAGVTVTRSAEDVALNWDPATLDAAGNPETVASYRIYRGTTPDFVPDRAGGSNRVGSVAAPPFTDTGAVTVAAPYFYLVSALDAAGNESGTRPPSVTTPPVLSGNWTDTTIELSWTGATPAGNVAGYRVYYGKASRRYEFFKDVGLATSTSLLGLETYVNWYSAVVAVDADGNESAYSNEHIDAVAGRVRVRAHDDDYLCWGAGGCPPKPGQVQRVDGWQLMVPTDFPVGDWKRVLVTYTIDSRLCKVGQNGTTDKCGGSNPGGYNPCGDPWDRIANLFLVLDDCIEAGTSCITQNNVELMRAITPFGTDAPAPKGDGVVPPRRLTLDVTPYAPLLTGRRYVGAEIGHYVQAGWHVTSEFEFSERPDEASPKKPAAGIEVIGFGGAPLPTRTVTVPANATKVYMRLFTTGHGGTQYCDGGTKDGDPCTASSQCPGGSCQNCDEFCHRTNQILRNNAVIFSTVPWVDCCVAQFPGDPFCQGCRSWNACGFPSCTFDRAGWCPGYIGCHKNAPCDQDLDLTSQFPPGGTYNIDYKVLVQRGSWLVSLALYWYTD
jgi:hypothetical protein